MKLVFGLLFLCCTACTNIKGLENITTASDPTERGLLYIAWAILVASFIRAAFNK